MGVLDKNCGKTADSVDILEHIVKLIGPINPTTGKVS